MGAAVEAAATSDDGNVVPLTTLPSVAVGARQQSGGVRDENQVPVQCTAVRVVAVVIQWSYVAAVPRAEALFVLQGTSSAPLSVRPGAGRPSFRCKYGSKMASVMFAPLVTLDRTARAVNSLGWSEFIRRHPDRLRVELQGLHEIVSRFHCTSQCMRDARPLISL